MSVEDMKKDFHLVHPPDIQHLDDSFIQPSDWVGPDSVYTPSGFPVDKDEETSFVPNGIPKLPKIQREELDDIPDRDEDEIHVKSEAPKMPIASSEKVQEQLGEAVEELDETNYLDEVGDDILNQRSVSAVSESENEVLPDLNRAYDEKTSNSGQQKTKTESVSSISAEEKSDRDSSPRKKSIKRKLKRVRRTSSSSVQSSRDNMAEAVQEKASDDPVDFYLKRIKSTQTIDQEADRDDTAASGSLSSRKTSAASIYKNSTSSFSTLSLRRSTASKDSTNDSRGTLDDLSNTSGMPSSKWFDYVHDIDVRDMVMLYAERAKYPTLNDLKPLEESLAVDGEKVDPQSEIDKLSLLIHSSSLPIPAFLRARGILYCQVGRPLEALIDLNNAHKHGKFKKCLRIQKVSQRHTFIQILIIRKLCGIDIIFF